MDNGWKNDLKKLALLALNVPFAVGLLVILENRMQFNTPGFWVAKRIFVTMPGKDFGPMAWAAIGIDFILCFAAVWVLSLLFLGIIHEVEK
jgi:hypothetical protein